MQYAQTRSEGAQGCAGRQTLEQTHRQTCSRTGGYNGGNRHQLAGVSHSLQRWLGGVSLQKGVAKSCRYGGISKLKNVAYSDKDCDDLR